MELLATHVPPGLVLDLGCGYGAIAAELERRGYGYCGLDLDADAVADLRARGHRAGLLDLRDLAGLPERLREAAEGETVVALCALDVLEHLPDTAAALTALIAASTMLHEPPPALVVSVPNVTHVDVAGKLVAGHWDVTDTGLLDRTHLQLFGDRRLGDVMARAGYREVARADFVLQHSDQHDPSSLPTLAPATSLAALLARVREGADPHARVNQFVRLYRIEDTATQAATPDEDRGAPFLTVVMRTQGRRGPQLEEALTCLLAQQDADFEVVLTVHASAAVVEGVRAQVARFPPAFAERVRIVQVDGGGRSHPLNVGLQMARGSYAAFLDDDDLVTDRWTACVTEASRANPGRLVRSVAVTRDVRLPGVGEAPAASVAAGPIEHPYPLAFDHIAHLYDNATPICAFAVPLALVRRLDLRFDDELEVLEDWDFQLRAAELAGVTSAQEITSLYQRWHGSGDTSGLIGPTVWKRMRRQISERLDARPYLLSAGAIANHEYHGELAATRARAHKVEADYRRVEAAYAELEGYTNHVLGDLARAEKRLAQIRRLVVAPRLMHAIRRRIGGARRRP